MKSKREYSVVGAEAVPSRQATIWCVQALIQAGRERLLAPRPPVSILRSQTNLPLFLLVALLLMLVCNFTLKETSAHASRPLGPKASIEEIQRLIRLNPDDYTLHSQIAELYFGQRQYRKSMFHLQEAGRLVERYGEE